MLKQASYWIEHLNLQKHPEGGYFKEVYRSDQVIPGSSLPENFVGDRCFSTSIFYLLQNDDFSTWHRIKSDELWHFYDGSSPIEIHVLPGKGYYRLLLGNNPENGESLQQMVPANTWFAAGLRYKGSFGLAGCTVAPGFDFSDFEMGNSEYLLKQFSGCTEIIKRYQKA